MKFEEIVLPSILLLRFIVPLFYFAISFGYIQEFVKNKHPYGSWIKPVLITGIIFHASLLLLLSVAEGSFPFGTIPKGLLLCSLMLSLLYIGIEYLFEERSYGAFIWPVNLLIVTFSLLFLYRGVPLPKQMMSYYFVIHILLNFMGIACFFLSFVISVMYLIQHSVIKRQRLNAFFHRLPSLETMDKSVMGVDTLGLSLFFLGLVIGYLWLDLSIGSSSQLTLKIGFAVLTVITYLAEHILRTGRGWKGQRACLVSIAGFCLVICNLIIGRHGY
jgi:HemX protein